LKALCVNEEIASTLRHRALNDLSGIGAMLYTLRRRLSDRCPEAAGDDEIRQLFTAIEDRVVGAGRRPPEHFLGPPARGGPGVQTDAALSPVFDAAAAFPRVRVRLEGGAERVRIDGAELQVAASCLVENAVEALLAAGGGTIVARVRVADPGEAALELDDDGEGLVEAARDRMFEPFFSTRPGHAGLGLNIARRLARRWGGDLVVTPLVPRGARACLTLPSEPRARP
jgi:signal transduction histidine kinase